MKSFSFLLLWGILMNLHKFQVSGKLDHNLICYYEPHIFNLHHLRPIYSNEIKFALGKCTHMIFGYVGVDPNDYELERLDERLKSELRMVDFIKKEYPNVKCLLSIGGGVDLSVGNESLRLLESGKENQKKFINSALLMARNYDLDGLDLALQLPRNRPRKIEAFFGKLWGGLKSIFTGEIPVDPDADVHKAQVTTLIRDLGAELKQKRLMLGLTVLPNVNATWYFDIPTLSGLLDYVNLAAFDFLTPSRNPEEADYTAPLYQPPSKDRPEYYNVDFQVNYWLHQGFPSKKLHLGIAAYANSWKLNSVEGIENMPLLRHTEGESDEGSISYAAFCHQFRNDVYRRVGDPSKKFGAIAYYELRGSYGMWTSFDDADVAAEKTNYAISKNLGGVALFDLLKDDWYWDDTFPMLTAIHGKMNHLQ